MLCPSCGKQAIGFLKFTFIDPRKTKCSHCKVQLKANDKLKSMFWKLLGYVFILFVITSLLMFIFKMEDLGIGVMILLLFPGLWYEYKEWKVGGYELLETNKNLNHIEIGTPLTERPSHTTTHTDRVNGGSADQAVKNMEETVHSSE